MCVLHNYVDDDMYDAGDFDNYPTEGYHSESDPPSPKHSTSTKGMWFESLHNCV